MNDNNFNAKMSMSVNNPFNKPKRKIRVGGADTYTIRDATLVQNYFPGPMRQNIRQDPLLMIGKFDPGTFGNDNNINGPGTIYQAIPDPSKYQNKQIMAVPRPNPNKLFAIDTRQIASYQVEQLKNNPLSIYTDNPDGKIPGFECLDEPDNFSTMINKRKSEYKSFFENGFDPSDFGQNGSQQVYGSGYPQLINSNADAVYNLSLDSKLDVNPMIAQGSSSVATSVPQFSGMCYSGRYEPFYDQNQYIPRTESDIGFMNKLAYEQPNMCEPSKSMSFSNPLILDKFN